MTPWNSILFERGARTRRLPALIAGLLAVAVISLAAFSTASAQPVAEWRTVLGGGEDDFAHAVALSDDGGYVIAGETRSFGSGSQDGWLVKLDSNGEQQWSQTYGGPESDAIYAVQRTGDGGYILAGETHSSESATASQSDYWLIKTDADGKPEWERSFGNSEQSLTSETLETSDVAHSVRQTRGGGYVLAGSSTSSSGTGVWLLRTDANGGLLWSRNPGIATGAVAYDAAETADNGFIVAGSADSVLRGSEAILIKTDSDGDTRWTKSFGGEFDDEARSLVLTGDGGYALGGFSWSNSAGLSDFWMVKTDGEGRLEWQRTFGGVAREAAHSLVQTSDGGYVLAGWSESFSRGDRFWIVKTGPTGRQLWNRAYTQTGSADAGTGAALAFSGARAIWQTEDRGFIIAGWTSVAQGSRDILAVKTASGELLPAAMQGPVVTLRNTGGVNIVSATIGFDTNGRGVSGSPIRFWRQGRLVGRDNPLPVGMLACSQPVQGFSSGGSLVLDQIGSFESVYINALSSRAESPELKIDNAPIEFNFSDNGAAIAGSLAVVSESPCEQEDLLLPEGPGAPGGLEAEVSDVKLGIITLDWEDSVESEVSGYAVYFARNASGPYRRLTWLLPDSSFADVRTGDGTTYFYVVSAINSWGLESPMSTVAEIESLDVTAPEPPTGLRLVRLDRSAGRAQLEWNISRGEAIRGYRLYRQDGEGPSTPITALLFGTGFEDWTLPAEGDFTYSVSVIDLAGNESGPSNIVPPELDFFGIILEVRRNSAGGGRLSVSTDRGRVDVAIVPDTEISIPNREAPGLDDLDPGDQVAVSLKPDGSAARQVHLVPSKTRNRHLAGRIIVASGSEVVIQTADGDGEQVTLPLTDSVEVRLHRGVTGLAEGTFIVVSSTVAEGESVATVSEINGIPGRDAGESTEGSEEPQESRNVAVVRGEFQGINPENANIIMSFTEVSLDVNTEMETGLSVGEPVVVEALLRPDGSLLARRVGQDEGIGQIAARTIMRGVFQESDTATGNWTVSGTEVLVDRRAYTDALPRAGQRVKVTATLQEDGALHAREVENQPETENPEGEHTVWLEGIFREITSGGAWDIGGVPVDVNANTALSGQPSVGSRVSVTATYSGRSLLANEVSANPSETNAAVRSVSIQGIVEWEVQDGWLVVDGIRIVLSDLTKILGDISIGSTVILKAEIQPDGSLIAREVAITDQDDQTGETRANPVDIEGRIERVEAEDRLLVNGIPVAISALTEINASLQVGAPVQVRGLLQRDGSVLARQILGYGPGITAGTEASIEGLVNEVATETDGRVSSFSVGGIPVTVDRLTRLAEEPAIGIALTVQGIYISGEILAVTVDSQPIGNVGVLPKVQMQGIVEDMPSRPVPLPLDVNINGVTARISGGTNIIGSLTEGAVVRTTGKVTGGVFLVEEIERLPAYDTQDSGEPARFRIKGAIQEANLDSDGRPDRLLVAGERIIVEALTVFQDTVAVGDSVIVEGVVQDGILLATRISLEESEEAGG